MDAHMTTPAIIRRRSERGFTLIEVLVVMLIIGILAAIAIASFLGQTTKANDAAAKSQVATAEMAAETYSTDHNGSYENMELSSLQAIEPTLSDTSKAKLTVPNATKESYEVTSESVEHGQHLHDQAHELGQLRTLVQTRQAKKTRAAAPKARWLRREPGRRARSEGPGGCVGAACGPGACRDARLRRSSERSKRSITWPWRQQPSPACSARSSARS